MEHRVSGLDSLLEPDAAAPVADRPDGNSIFDDVIVELWYAAADLRSMSDAPAHLRIVELLAGLARALERHASRPADAPPTPRRAARPAP